MILAAHGENCVCSLTTCSGKELTARVPCEVRFGRIRDANFETPDCVLSEGVAERLVAYCDDCGGIVAAHRLGYLFVLHERGPAVAVDGRVIVFHEHFTPGATA